MKQIAKFVVGLGERVAPTDIEEGMRVGYVREKLKGEEKGWIEVKRRNARMEKEILVLFNFLIFNLFYFLLFFYFIIFYFFILLYYIKIYYIKK